jgi:hypothetical protein
MVVLAFDGPTKNVTIEMSNLLIEDFVSMFQTQKA